MTDPGVLLVQARIIRGNARLPSTWPKYDDAPLGPVVSLREALEGHYSVPTYMMQCEPMMAREGRAPRLATLAYQQPGGVRMRFLLTDVDASAKSLPGFAIGPWWEAQAPALALILAAHPGAFVACSRGGLRVYQRLSEPFVVDSLERADEWKARYDAHCSALRALPWAGAKVDGTKDWSRLQRVPHDTRDGALQLLPTIGDPAEVGTIALPPPAPRRARAGLRAWTGATVPVKVGRWVLERVAAALPRQGDGVHEAAMALGGVLAASEWSTEDCVEVAEVIFSMAGLSREDIGRSARDSLMAARSGQRCYGWPRLRSVLRGEPAVIASACDALEHNVPGLSRPKGI